MHILKPPAVVGSDLPPRVSHAGSLVPHVVEWRWYKFRSWGLVGSGQVMEAAPSGAASCCLRRGAWSPVAAQLSEWVVTTAGPPRI